MHWESIVWYSFLFRRFSGVLICLYVLVAQDFNFCWWSEIWFYWIFTQNRFIIGLSPEFLNTGIMNHFPNRTLSCKTHHLYYKNFGNTGCLKQRGMLLTAPALNKAIWIAKHLQSKMAVTRIMIPKTILGSDFSQITAVFISLLAAQIYCYSGQDVSTVTAFCVRTPNCNTEGWQQHGEKELYKEGFQCFWGSLLNHFSISCTGWIYFTTQIISSYFIPQGTHNSLYACSDAQVVLTM